MIEHKLTLSQIDKMRHAIGFGRDAMRKLSYIPYRNYFCCDSDDEDWEYLVSIGYATKKVYKDKKQTFYYISNKGKEYLTCLFGVVIKKDLK